MSDHAERDALQTMLDALDRGEPELRAKVAARPADGLFFGPVARARLDDVDVLLLLSALRHRLANRVVVPGGELATDVATTTSERLECLTHLDGDSRLLTSGFLVSEVAPADASEAQRTSFHLADPPFRLACALFANRDEAPAPVAPPSGPYRTNAELLTDLRRLSIAYRGRAVRTFHLDPWAGTGLEVVHGEAELVRRARRIRDHVFTRVAATPTDAALPILALRDEHGLTLDELVILVTLLFQELIEGVATVDAADLVKLVCESEAELLERRMLLRPLARKGLVRLDGIYAEKELTADASLPNATVERMLDSGDIDTDERIDFHHYLAQLESSDPFFFDLDSGGLQDP